MNLTTEGGAGEPAACAGCGAVLPGGTAGCQALADERLVREFADLGRARFHRLATDCYCLQHPDRYCRSAKSLAAHLAGLCWALEYGGHPSGYTALNRFLDGTPALTKPEIPAARGTVTLADVVGAADAEAYARAVDAWARSIWAAYGPLRPVARTWIQTALARPKGAAHRRRWSSSGG